MIGDHHPVVSVGKIQSDDLLRAHDTAGARASGMTMQFVFIHKILRKNVRPTCFPTGRFRRLSNGFHHSTRSRVCQASRTRFPQTFPRRRLSAFFIRLSRKGKGSAGGGNGCRRNFRKAKKSVGCPSDFPSATLSPLAEGKADRGED